MPRTHPTSGLLASEAGDTLIEVIVAALILGVIVLGTLAGFDISGRTSVGQRQYQEAESLADQALDELDAENVSSLRLADSQGNKYVTSGGTTYTITKGIYYENAKGESECSTSNGGSTYLKTETTVTWQGMPNPNAPVRSTRFLSLDQPGVLMVHAGTYNNTTPWTTTNGTYDAFVQLGFNPPTEAEFAPTQFGSTGEDGCAVFSGLIPGDTYMARPVNYFLSTQDAHLITDTFVPGTEKFYEYPVAQTVTIPTNGSAASLNFVFAYPGSITAKFESNGAQALGETIVVTNTAGPTLKSLYFPSAPSATSKAPASSSVVAEALFPFSPPTKTTENPYTVYAGTCTADNPSTVTSGAVKPQEVPVTAGSTGTKTNTTTVKVPPVYLKIYSGESASSPGSLQSAAPTSVHMTDTGCSHKYEYESALSTTAAPSSSTGALANPALPFGTYEACVAENVKPNGEASPSQPYYIKATGISNASTSGVTKTLYWKKEASTTACT
jgi:type II secretory pathway pseudopilin PulG